MTRQGSYGFAVQFPDGTRAVFVAGRIVLCTFEGERPAGWWRSGAHKNRNPNRDGGPVGIEGVAKSCSGPTRSVGG